MATIGIVSTHGSKAALTLKDAILKFAPDADVLIDAAYEEDGICVREQLIFIFQCLERLTAKGAECAVFTDKAAHEYFSELQDSTCLRLIDPCFADGALKSPAQYAQNIIQAPQGLLPKPFTIGILGGMGPMASVDLYKKLTQLTPARKDQEHIKLILVQNPQTPDRTECLLEHGKEPTIALYKAAKTLEDAGADCIAIGCNTAHAFLPAVSKHIRIPFVDMQETSLDEIEALKGKSAVIGLLATTGTVRSGIYSQKAAARGLALAVPDERNQEKVMRCIVGPKGVKAGFTDGECRQDLLDAAAYLVKEKGCNVLILGCTELPLVLDEGEIQFDGKTAFCVDPTSAVARRLVSMALENRKKTRRM